MVARTESETEGSAPPLARATEVYQAARERTASAYEAARSRATDVTRQATDQLAIYPVAAVIGGFAIGALLAAVLPRTQREEDLLGETGRKLAGAAKDAAQRGLDLGREQFDEIRGKAAQKVGEAVADVVAGKQ
jgi:hypothetical protein